ncbi:XrtA/PEP-CTERM system TPR-repeat protein PrsT [Neptunicella marina]|uniref:PEP-CTERM system TPR-repeat protein PrsT n=1 Tax=Neptunicella marina TaxID=2125989 RepID=A0A8J6ISW7_9ALTE|nr:XrtA/PEP-CTERM system TPR-repeat protein PrsT [Neptunicella marina]MBC3765784.1 PEP-CTERM system TPR-repeat protein PrsT [Neptunicella marina]
MTTKKLTITLVAAAIISLTGCGQKSAEQYLESAQQFQQQGDFKSAIIELKNAISANPSNSEMRLKLGQIYLEQSNFTAADKELNKALDLNATADDVLPFLVKTQYYLADYERAVSLAQSIQLSDEQAQSRVSFYSYISNLRSPLPSTDYSFPQDLIGDDQILGKIYQALTNNELESAEQLSHSLEENNYELAQKNYVKGLIASQQQKFSEASQYYQKALKIYPSWHQVSFQLADAQIRDKDYNAASSVIDRLLTLNKENPYANLLKARIYFEQQDYAKALPHAEKAVQNGLNSKMAQLIAGSSALKEKKLELAYKYLTQAAQGMSKDNLVYRLLAQTQLLLGYTEEAQNTLSQLEGLSKIDADLFSSTGIKLALKGDVDEAKTFFEKANQADSSNAANLLKEGMLKLATDDASAITTVEKAIQQDDELKQAWMVLARAYLKQGKNAEAFKVANDWQQKSPADGLTLKGVIYQELNQPQKAAEAFKQALEIEPTHVGAYFLLLRAYQQLNELDRAIEVGRDIITISPDEMRAYVLLLQLFEQSHKLKEIKPILEQKITEEPDLLSPKVALALYYRSSSKPQEAISILEPITELNSLGLIILGDSNLQAKDLVKASAAYNRLRDKFPNDSRGWLRGIGVLELQGNTQQALELTEKALKKFPNSQSLKLLQINYQTQTGQLEKANHSLTLLKNTQNAENDTLLKYEGELALANKNFKQAQNLLEKFYERYPSFISAVPLARAMQSNNQFEKASKLLEDEYAKLDDPNKHNHTMAEFFSFNGAYEKAALYYQNALKLNPQDIAAINNLAIVEISRGNSLKGLELAKQAYSLSPSIPQIEDTLGFAYLRNEQLEQANTHLTNATKLLPNDNDAKLHYAELLILTDKHSQARKLLENLTSESAKIISRKEELLNKLQ